jgi:hypothetical protein
MKAPTAAPMISERQFHAAATALLVAGTLLILHAASRAGSASALAPAARAGGTIHDGIDWARVNAAPDDAGATVGAHR